MSTATTPTPATSSRRRTTVAAFALVGAFAAGFAGMNVLASSDDAPPAGETSFGAEISAATTPGVPTQFDGGVAVTVADVTDDDGICVEAAFPDGSVLGSCYPLAGIESGFAMVTGNVEHDGPLVTVGIVPDGVQAVHINGMQTSVKGNFWMHVGEAPGSDGPVEIVGSSGTVEAALPAEYFGTNQPLSTLPRDE